MERDIQNVDLCSLGEAARRIAHFRGRDWYGPVYPFLIGGLADSYADRILVSYGSANGPLRQPEEIAVSTEMPLRREIEAFLKFLQGGPAPRSSAAEGLVIVERIAASRTMAGLP